MKRIFALATISVALGCGPHSGFPDDDSDGGSSGVDSGNTGGTPTRNILVRTVIDGDTIIVSAGSTVTTPDGRAMDGTHIRLLGIDAPEIAHGGTGAECYGPEASEFAAGLVGGRLVTLEYDPTKCRTNSPSGCRDDYDRLLAYIQFDGKVLNEELLKGGYARVFRGTRFQHRDSTKYASLESTARSARLGLWSCPN